MNNNYKKLMNEAEDFLRVALREYQKGKGELIKHIETVNGRNVETGKRRKDIAREKNDMKIRQGADKAWNASVQATKALAKKMGKRIPRSYNAQLQFLLQIERERPDISNGYPFLLAFKEFSKGLHGECFYHGEYILDDLDHDFESVKRYIEVIEKV